jgi:hypothetical protein
MTRSVRDISQSSRQQSAQYDRMGGAMQAVIEIAEQVAGNSQQTAESAERLELIVRQLQQLVGARRPPRKLTTSGHDDGVMVGAGMGMNGMDGGMMMPNGGMGQQGMRSIRPMGQPGGMPPGGMPMGPNTDRRGMAGAGMGNGYNNGYGGYGDNGGGYGGYGGNGGGYGEYDGYNNGYGGGNPGQMMPMNGGGQDWRVPPMPAMPQPGQNQLPPGPPMGRMQFGDNQPPQRGPQSRGMSRGGGHSQFNNNWRRDPYGPDGDDGGRR